MWCPLSVHPGGEFDMFVRRQVLEVRVPRDFKNKLRSQHISTAQDTSEVFCRSLNETFLNRRLYD